MLSTFDAECRSNPSGWRRRAVPRARRHNIRIIPRARTSSASRHPGSPPAVAPPGVITYDRQWSNNYHLRTCRRVGGGSTTKRSSAPVSPSSIISRTSPLQREFEPRHSPILTKQDEQSHLDRVRDSEGQRATCALPMFARQFVRTAVASGGWSQKAAVSRGPNLQMGVSATLAA